MLKNQPKVSVIIPVFKVEKTLKRCVDSVLRQTYENLEIILVDDGSPDDCPEICDSYLAKDSRIKVVHKQNGGLSDARNAGIKIATGEYINFVDSDDFIHHQAIETLVNVTLKTEADLVSSNPAKISNGLQITKRELDVPTVKILDRERALEEMLYAGEIDCYAWGKLYKKELFDWVRFPVGKLFEDTGTTYKIIDLCQKIAAIDQQIYYYIDNTDGITKSSFSEKKMDLVYFVEEIRDFVNKKYPNLAKAANAKLFTVALYTMFDALNSNIPVDDCVLKCEEAIFMTKKSVLFDQRVRFTDRKFAWLSLLGKQRVRQLFLLKQKLKAKK